MKSGRTLNVNGLPRKYITDVSYCRMVKHVTQCFHAFKMLCLVKLDLLSRLHYNSLAVLARKYFKSRYKIEDPESRGNFLQNCTLIYHDIKYVLCRFLVVCRCPFTVSSFTVHRLFNTTFTTFFICPSEAFLKLVNVTSVAVVVSTQWTQSHLAMISISRRKRCRAIHPVNQRKESLRRILV